MRTIRSRRFSPPRPLFRGLVAVFALTMPAPLRAAEIATGERIYRAMCASCHGPTGEGTKVHFPRPLIGDQSVSQLAKLIARTMPEDDPGACIGADANKVAAYIYDAFYSTTARERNRPARIELARLTVRQYRNAAADLVDGFRTSGKWDDKRGLRAEYFSGRGFRNDKRVLDRLDPEVRFDFGTDSPVAGKIEPHEFLIRWAGSVLAPETGEYEFIVRTEHSARLWVNDTKRPLIDAWVKSGKDTEYRGSIYLIAGRVYPLRLEYSKAKQGVDDSKTNKTKPPPVKSSIALEWQAPHSTAEVIPARNLSPNTFPESFAVTTAFPPDDRSYGWERGTTVSKEWDAGNHRRGPGNRRIRGGPSRRTIRRPGYRSEPGHKTPRILSPFRRTSVSPTAHRRAETSVHRPAVRGRQGSGVGRQACRPARPQVPAIPLPRSGQRSGRL